MLDRRNAFVVMCDMYGIEGLDVARLEALGFFTAPSSTKHHGVYEGGNFDHSYEVAKFLVALTESGRIKWQNPRSPWVVGIFHDICKSSAYKPVQVAEGESPKWDYSTEDVLSGHGDKSIMLLAQFMQLTEEEVFCIRYHMGAYVKEDWDGYDKAIKKYQNVLWTHTADMYVSKVLGL